MLRGAGYARLSLVRDGVIETGTERQSDDVLSIAAREGVRIVHQWVDSGRSAFTGKERQEFTLLIEALDRGEIDVLIAWKFDRLTRNLQDYARLEKAIKAAGAHIITGDGVDTRQGWLGADMLFTMARNESENISRRVKRKHREQAETGRPHGGPRPFGYEYADGQLVPRADEAEFLRYAADAILIQGASLTGLCREAKDKGIKGATGKPLNRNALRTALIAPRTAGLRTYQGDVHGNAEWDGILDQTTWRELRRKLTDPKRRAGPRNRSYPLLGVLHCGRCGERMDATMYSHGPRAYRCDSRRGCGGATIKASDVEQMVRELVLQALTNDDIRAQLEAADDIAEDRAAALQRLEQLEQEKHEAAQDYYAKLISRSTFEERVHALNAQLTETEQQLQRLTGGHSLGSVPREFDGLSIAWKASAKLLALQVFSRVLIHPAPNLGSKVVDPRRIEPVWRVE